MAVIKSSIYTGGERDRVRGKGQVTDRPSRRRSLCDSNIYIDFFLGNKESPLVGLELEWSGAAWPGLAVDELCVDALLSVQAARQQ